MNTIDAIGFEIELNKYYGYSKSENGFTRVMIGKAVKANEGKVTLSEVNETTYLYVSSDNYQPKIKYTEKKRTLASIQLFPLSPTYIHTYITN